MKKIVCVIISILMILCLFTSCVDSKTDKNSTTQTSYISVASSSTDVEEDTSSETTLKNIDSKGAGGGVMSVYKYRDMFYAVPAPFVNLVGKEIFFAWRETIDATATAETMVMSQFIQYFGITREQFDKANLEWAKGIRDNLDGVPCINPKDYANQITDEIFNGDIIFTFDDDLIREYYLAPDYPFIFEHEYEEAVANGEYTSQTEEWVDIEQMEAEIIAKYGEAEIETTVSAEISAPDESTEAVDIPAETDEQTTA